jgi:hypothetical protein
LYRYGVWCVAIFCKLALNIVIGSLNEPLFQRLHIITLQILILLWGIGNISLF